MGRFRPVSSIDGVIGRKHQQAPYGLKGGPSSLHKMPLLNLNWPFFRICLHGPVPFLGVTLRTAHDKKDPSRGTLTCTDVIMDCVSEA